MMSTLFRAHGKLGQTLNAILSIGQKETVALPRRTVFCPSPVLNIYMLNEKADPWNDEISTNNLMYDRLNVVFLEHIRVHRVWQRAAQQVDCGIKGHSNGIIAWTQ